MINSGAYFYCARCNWEYKNHKTETEATQQTHADYEQDYGKNTKKQKHDNKVHRDKNLCSGIGD